MKMSTLKFNPYGEDKNNLGPLSALNKPQYNVNSFTYPSNLGLDPGLQHYVTFYINESQNTTFSTQTAVSGAPLTGGPGDVPTINLQPNNISNSTQAISRVATAISLYMPPNITTNYKSEWESQDLAFLGSAIQDLSNGSLGQLLKDGLGSAARNLGDFLGARTDLQANNSASQAYRVSFNPHAEVLFNGVPFRSFNFQFQMVPRTSAEAVIIDNIVKAFAFYSACEINPDKGRWLLYPSEFDIRFYKGTHENTFINRISTCALTEFKVNYTGAGSWSAMNDGAPMQTNIDLTFTELELMHKQRILQGF